MARKIIKQNSSFGVLRANPRISGNVKITVDSSEEIWLNSIDSNQEMSNKSYKGFRIPQNSSYDKDLYSFFNKGKTSPDFVFGIYGESDPVQNQINSLSDSYDFRYSMGVTPLISDKYPENFSYLSPFYLGEDIPDYFVIFRINDPIDYSYRIPVTELEVGKSYKVVSDSTQNFKINSGIDYSSGDTFIATQTYFNVIDGSGSVILLDPLFNLNKIQDPSLHFGEKILPKSTIVATYDLTESSKIGKYLRNIKNASEYTDSLIDVKFEENQITTFNGVNYSVGIFDKKGDYLLDYFKTPQPQIGFEEYITNGFKRNGIISYKLLNLEFLFNDEEVENYTINRYFGLYVNAAEISSFKLDGNSLYENRNVSNNTPLPSRNEKGYYYQDVPFYQYNKDGVRIYLDSEKIKGVIPNSDDVNFIEGNKIFWIKDKNGDFHSLRRDPDYFSSPIPDYLLYGTSNKTNQLVLQDRKIDLSLLTGSDKSTKKQYYGEITGEKGRAYSVIRIENELSLSYSDSLVFYNPLGSKGSAPNRYDIIRASDLSSIIDEWVPGSYYAVDDTYYFNPLGTPSDIAKSLTGIFNSFRYNSFEAFQSGNEILIRTNAASEKENKKYSLDFYQDFSTGTRLSESRSGLIFINDNDCSAINQRQYFTGGSSHINSRVKVKIEDANKIIVGETFIETVKTTSTDTMKNTPGSSNKGASIVKGKYRFVDEYAKDENGEILGIKDFETHATLEISNYTEKISIGTSETITAFETYNVTLGVFSFYGLRELDGDFWSSEYGYTPTQEYYKYLDVQPSKVLNPDNITYTLNEDYTKIVPGKSYYVSDGASIEYPEGTSVSGGTIFIGQSGFETYVLNSSSSGESNVYPTLSSGYPSQISPSLYDYNTLKSFYPDLDSFPGFSGIQSIKFIDDQFGLETKKSKMYFGKLDSEYEYTKDNYNKDFALKSRVSPYISKWVYNGGTDARGNGYRLNSNLGFTPLNFSPSFFRRTQDPQYFTHEWYHLQKPPYSLPESNLHKDKSYLSGEISLALLTDANPALHDYFLDYFSVEGEDLKYYYLNSDTIDSVNLSERYTMFSYNKSSGFSDSLFRGAKVRIKKTFKDYTQGGAIKYLNNDTFYNDYKFSSVIVPVKNIDNEIQVPIKIKVIENRTFKTITFVVEVLIDDQRAIDFDEFSPSEQSIDLDYFLLYSLKDKIEKNNINYDSKGYADAPKYGDVKLSIGLNLSTSPNQDGAYSMVNPSSFEGSGVIYSTDNIDLTNPRQYETDLREEINLTYLPNTPNSSVGLNGPGTFYGVVGSDTTYNLPFPTGVGENFINFTNTDPVTYNFDLSVLGLLPNVQFIPSSASYTTIKDIPIYQREGGKNYWKSIFEKLSFANLSLWVNTGYQYIDYKTYYWDETTSSTKVIDGEFSLEFLKPSSFEQRGLLNPIEDLNKPVELSLSTVGYTLETIQGISELYRYSGEYVPLFREILKFENVKNDLPYWVLPENQTFIVTVSEKTELCDYFNLGSNKTFFINGIEQNEISLVKGLSYYFDLSDPSNLGYNFYLSLNSKGDSYSTDALLQGYYLIGTPGTPNSKVIFEVPYNINSNIYYVAQSTSIGVDGRYMGNRMRFIDPIEYSYCSFGFNKDGFGKIKNVNYYKYSSDWIFKIGKDSAYNPLYNLISETPVDKRDLSLFESTWDPGFYRQYDHSSSYQSLPGTKSMKELKSFFGSKVMKTPESISSQKQLVHPSSIDKVITVDVNNYPNYEILWEETDTEIRGILLIDRMTTRYFLEDGGKKTFNNFIVPEFGFGSSSDVNDDFKEYMEVNILPTFKCENNGAYLKKIPLKAGTTLTVIEGGLADYQKLLNSYYISQEIKFTKVNELRYEFSLTKDPSYDYSLAFSIQVVKI